MRKHLAIIKILLIIPFFCSCQQSSQSYKLKDVRNAEIILITKRPHQENVHRLDIHVDGYIEGKAKITLMLEGAPHHTKILSGKIDLWLWGTDWYHDNAEIKYEPSSVTSGEVELKYIFFDL